MTKLKKYKIFIKESISGTELVGPVGPGYGETGLQNKTVNASDTTVILSQIDGHLYTEDEYNDIYGEYLKKGGKPLPSGFNVEDIDIVVSSLKN